MLDGGYTVLSIIAGVTPVLVAGKMPGRPAIEIEEAIIAFAHHQDRGTARQSVAYDSRQTRGQPAVTPLASKGSSAKGALIFRDSDGFEPIPDQLTYRPLRKVCLDVSFGMPAAAGGQFPVLMGIKSYSTGKLLLRFM